MKVFVCGYEFLKKLISSVRSKPRHISFLSTYSTLDLFISACAALLHMEIHLPYHVCKNKKQSVLNLKIRTLSFVTLYRTVLQYNHKITAGRSHTFAENSILSCFYHKKQRHLRHCWVYFKTVCLNHKQSLLSITPLIKLNHGLVSGLSKDMWIPSGFIHYDKMHWTEKSFWWRFKLEKLKRIWKRKDWIFWYETCHHMFSTTDHAAFWSVFEACTVLI